MLATSMNKPQNPHYHVIVGIKKLREYKPRVGSFQAGVGGGEGQVGVQVSRPPDLRACG